MTDFTPNYPLYYQPLNNITPNDKLINEAAKTPEQYQPQIQLNQNYNSSGINATYKSPFFSTLCFIVIFIFLFATGFGSIMIVGAVKGEYKMMLAGLIVSFILYLSIFLAGSLINVNSIITIESSLGTVKIIRRKICCCFNRRYTININEIRLVIVQTDNRMTYKSGKNTINCFEIIFQLNNGREIKGCSGAIDENGEARKAFLTIRNALPSSIPFTGDLAYVD